MGWYKGRTKYEWDNEQWVGDKKKGGRRGSGQLKLQEATEGFRHLETHGDNQRANSHFRKKKTRQNVLCKSKLGRG